MPEEYLGDGVYAKFDGYAVELWTDRQDNGRNWIVLEPLEVAALERFWKRVHAKEDTIQGANAN